MSKAIEEKLRPLLVKCVGVKQIRMIGEDAARDKAIYDTLIKLIQDNDKTCRMKASWALAKATEIEPGRAMPHVPMLMNRLSKEPVNGVVREIFKTLACVEIPDQYEGAFIDASFAMLREPDSDVAVKHHSKAILMKAVKKYPELKNELILSLQSVMDMHTEPWKIQVMKTIAKLEKMK